MRSQPIPTVYRKDYQAPAFRVTNVEMGVDLDTELTTVATRLTVERVGPGDLLLNGDDLELLFVAIDGRPLEPNEFGLTSSTLAIPRLPKRCVVDIAVRIRPVTNTSLQGLYVSRGNLFTQCEAEGFRRITYYLDRPDVMARFTVMLRADIRRFPVLLSNGNLIESGPLPNGRHYAKWDDPFQKPSYLFAIVAGRLAHVEQRLTTLSGCPALLQIFAERRDLAKLGFALQALEHAIRWDEKRFGLELDLERFMIVAVSDFNAGAMENKGLNIFNTQFVLADAELATDVDFSNIESVVGHEYFHNWTGNRVTCRDWFQLTLKEGLTVFRDQEFSADMAAGFLDGSDRGPQAAAARAANRIETVRGLRAAQFPEDAGPMAHPVRPESYQEIGNFYTSTVYEKGAEVIRMVQTLLGRDGFREGLREYLRRHDGHAATCDDFLAAMESVYLRQHPDRNLNVFRRWYVQAGTPRLSVTMRYDATAQSCTLNVRQACPRVGIERHGRHDKLPFHIPLAVGLVGRDGHDLPLRVISDAADEPVLKTRVLNVTETEQEFCFVGVSEQPVPSLLRDFSAPVIVNYAYNDRDLERLSAHDSDSFNRWEAGQRLASRELVRLAGNAMRGEPLELNPALVRVYGATLDDTDLDPALKQLALTLPAESVIGEELPVYDPAAVHTARRFVRRALAASLRASWQATFEANVTDGPYDPSPPVAARRALKNLSLAYLAELGDEAHHDMAWRQFRTANNMSDRLSALITLTNQPASRRADALAAFYRRYRNESLALDKWLRVQAQARRIDRPVLDVVKGLTAHSAFTLANPNKVYSLLGTFFGSNPAEFHRPDGAAYGFWGDEVLALDKLNPQIAGRMARSLDRWRKLTPSLQDAARLALERVRRTSGLSKDVTEVVVKALGA